MKVRSIASISALLLVLGNSLAWSQDPIPFVPSTMPVVDRMLELAEVRKDDFLYDLGSGDGRILTQTDISKATVVTLYMFKWFNNAIKPKLQKLKPGSRIVAHDYDIDDWKPTTVLQLEPTKDPGIERHHTLYLWKVGIESAQR